MSVDPITFILWFVCGLISLILFYIIINDILRDWNFIRRKKNNVGSV